MTYNLLVLLRNFLYYFGYRFNVSLLFQTGCFSFCNEKFSMTNKLSFISNSVKGIQASNKRINHLKYQDLHDLKWFDFLTKNCQDEFKGSLSLSHAKSNSCGVALEQKHMN